MVEVLCGGAEVSREHAADPPILERRGKDSGLPELLGKLGGGGEQRPSGAVILMCYRESPGAQQPQSAGQVRLPVALQQAPNPMPAVGLAAENHASRAAPIRRRPA